jgi:hypothetical protein
MSGPRKWRLKKRNTTDQRNGMAESLWRGRRKQESISLEAAEAVGRIGKRRNLMSGPRKWRPEGAE